MMLMIAILTKRAPFDEYQTDPVDAVVCWMKAKDKPPKISTYPPDDADAGRV